LETSGVAIVVDDDSFRLTGGKFAGLVIDFLFFCSSIAYALAARFLLTCAPGAQH
jgi:hypothetical protein